ncbi:hypothetical protein [Aquihabitans sp. McL0605]|uniref:hypothetical protein n=1 Tax=Aquihabitans sp. McL0605 TaxID=3415671 RepID=UPI003CF63D7E
MATRFIEGPGIWSDITEVCRGSSRVVAAVAFVGAQAPALLPLKSGDLLIVNASKQSLLARATNPEALATYVDRGVTVRSSSTLHAKVVAASRRAVIGSANASTHSDQLLEAAVVTTDTELIREARAFVLSVQPDEDVDDLFLTEARRIWAMGRNGGPPGSGDREQLDSSFLPEGPFRLWLSADRAEDELGPEDQAAFAATTRRNRRGFPAARFTLDWESSALGDEYRRGDVILHVWGEGEARTVGRPWVVVTDPIKRTRRRSQFQVLRSRVADEDRPLSSVLDALRSSDVLVSFTRSHVVRNAVARRTLLGLWGLDLDER